MKSDIFQDDRSGVLSDEVNKQRDGEAVRSVRIYACIADKITYATQQNDIALIADLAIRNETDQDLENLTLTLATDPEVISPRTWVIDRISANSDFRLNDRNVPLSGALLSELTESMRAELSLVLRHGDEELASLSQPLTALAHNEWGGAQSMPELLAAFVMPNDPAVSLLLKSAGEVLRSAGKQSSFEGYQGKSRQRVWEMSSAIWSALASKRLIYASPPASFERNGQKIRTPDEIWNGGLATCLDTTVLFAAALEQAGLNALVAFTEGHALCGVWLQPQYLPSLTTDDPSDLRKHIDMKELVVFETTLVTADPPAKFSKAVAEGARRVSEEWEHEFVYALDMKRARSQQITPMASQRIADASLDEPAEGTIEGLEAAPQLPSFDLGVGEMPALDTPETRLDHWKRKLLDLTKRNRLLNLRESKTAIRIVCPDPATLEDKLADGKPITMIPDMEIGDTRDAELHHARTGEDLRVKYAADALDRNEIVAKLNKDDLESGLIQLYRKARTDLQEGGANTLYLALGFLRWKQSPTEQRSYRAPLILLPVKLERRSAASKVKIRQHEDEAVFNMTLLELLRQDFELRIPELEGDLPTDESGVDVTLIWNIVRHAVRDIQGFEVTEDIVLSTFSFAKYLMWKDLADRTEALKQSELVAHLIENPRDPYRASADIMTPDQIDRKIHPADLFMPLPADSSQIVAVHASAQGGDFVLEGPPGTGKSQTIANIIAHNLALKRRVLFVSEKMAALEVVYERLKQIGLGDFCLELHSSKANKKDVIQQLGRSWDARLQHTDVEWQERANEVKAIRDELNALVDALHRPGAAGISPRSAIGRVAAYGNTHRLRLDWPADVAADRVHSREDWQRLKDLAAKLGNDFADLDPMDRDSLQWIGVTNWSMAWQADLLALAQDLAVCSDDLHAAACDFLQRLTVPMQSPDLSAVSRLADLAGLAEAAADHDLGFAIAPDGADQIRTFETAVEALGKYQSGKDGLSTGYAHEAIARATPDLWQAKLDKAEKAIWPIGPLSRRSLANAMRKACGLTVRPDPKTDLPVLERLQSQRSALAATEGQLNKLGWEGLDQPLERARERLEAGRQLNACMMALAGDASRLADVRAGLNAHYVEGRAFLSAGTPLREAADRLVQSNQDFRTVFKAFRSKAETPLMAGDASLQGLAKTARELIALKPRINAWCRWLESRQASTEAGIETLARGLETVAVLPTNAQAALETAYCAWLAERFIDARQELRSFSARQHEDRIARFRELDGNLAKLSTQYVRAVLSGSVPGKDAPQRSEGFGFLAHELRKQRAHKPVRQLVEKMGDALTQLTPCLMMSPLSVAQFLSAGDQLFDLVVFDEASQITVWDSIGAIARGRNAIIVGDPKQMPPTNFFNKSAGGDGIDGDGDSDGAGFDDDLESILDEALAASIKHHRLTGHYRSRHESLIAFSNHQYYNGELVTYPAVETRASAVSFHKVDGEYLRGKGRTNPPEAKAVVAEVVRRLRDPDLNRLSIGVVALNGEQQRLIENLLDDERRSDPSLEEFFGDDAREPVFIKNLETVQGDARDVILLSIGYGPTEPGGRTMSMNFGPLNRQGGERRLNVAITRATTEVVVFASFTPEMIDLTRTRARAVADLKHYLEFAQRGPSALGEAIQSLGGAQDYESDFEKAVAERLSTKGWQIVPQVGVSRYRIDLGIIHPDFPGRFLAGIECDGATYHSSPSARDRDRVRHAILENLGWELVRIWSTDFFIDPSGTVDRVHDALDHLLVEDRRKVQEANAEKPAAQVESL